MEEKIARILEIISRRKALALEGNGLMQWSEYDEIETLIRQLEDEMR